VSSEQQQAQRSYERINYSLRPAKSIERKMLCEAFRRLSEFRGVESYQYIGFGSTYFSDFQLFHKALNLSTMLSFERDVENSDRFRFNRPYHCIEMRFGDSNDLLPDVNWEIPSILWLDYDGKLDESVLQDVKTAFSKASPGSVVIVSVNAHPARGNEADPDFRLKQLKDSVGETKVPATVTAKDLREWGTARAYRSIIHNEIDETLSDRNGARPLGTKLKYRQLFNFHYADGAKMLTVGGILYDEGQTGRLQSCNFDALKFTRTGVDPYFIEPPNLTYREMRHIDTFLPIRDAEILLPGVPAQDIQRYSELYRYFPHFAETEL
jgi:hypothetical protein